MKFAVNPELEAISQTISILLFENVKNMSDLKQSIIKGKMNACLIKPSMIMDVFHVMVATNKALRAESRKKMTTRGIYGEIILNLSANKSISDAFAKFGISEDDTEMLAVIIKDEDEEIESELISMVDGNITDLENLSCFTNVTKIQTFFQLPHEKDNISDIITSRIATKEFLVL